LDFFTYICQQNNDSGTNNNMVRKANKSDIGRIIELLHQVDMVHHVIRPDLFKPNTTKYNEQELEALLENESKPIFVFDSGNDVLGHAFCLITEVRDDKLLQDIKTLYIDDICVDEKSRGLHVGKALYEYVHDYALSIGCNNITLNVWEGNGPALSFYRNMGMKVQKTTMEIIL
jgi:ribosomal protein S18 acetylase RimI-like enzyme